MTNAAWGPDRQRAAAGALLLGSLTATAASALATSAWQLYVAGAYVVVAGLAVWRPAWITVQVIAGQVLVAGVLASLGDGGMVSPGAGAAAAAGTVVSPAAGALSPAHGAALSPARAVLALPVTFALVAAVVATAELLALVARSARPLHQRPRAVLRHTAALAVAGGAIAAAVLLASWLPGPSGLLAIMLGAAACIAVAMVLVWTAAPGASLDARPQER